ncbi:reverse transcriptase domain-containing protein [Tanacetum coccineum]
MTYPPLWLEGLPFDPERDLLPIILRNLRIVSSGIKPSSRWLPVWESAKRRPTPFAIHNEDLHTELEYFSEEYDEEREMEPRPAPVRETTLVLHIESPSRRQKERVVEFKDFPNMDGDRVERNSPALSSSLSKKREWSTFIVIFDQCLFADSTGCVTPFVHWIKDYPLLDGLKMPYHVGSYDGKGDPNNYLYLFEGAICMPKWAMHVACHMFTYTLKDSARIWWNGQKAGSILNYEDLKEKFRSHFSQQKKFTKTHLAVHKIKQREGESTRAFVTRYTDDTLQILGLHEEHRISRFVYGLKTRSLMEFLSTDLPTTYKGIMDKTYTWIEAREVATNGTPNDQVFGKFKKKNSWDNNKGKKNISGFSPYRGANHGLLSNLSKSPREILATKKGEHSWPLDEVPLEITIGESPFARTELLNFVIVRYCPPSLIAKQLEDIHNFKQEGDESLYQAWERYNDLLYKCPTHDINSHQKVNIFYKGLSTMNRQLLDSQGPIPRMRPAQALIVIQTMADHSQKWHDGTTSKSIRSSSSNDGLVALVNKLDNLG